MTRPAALAAFITMNQLDLSGQVAVVTGAGGTIASGRRVAHAATAVSNTAPPTSPRVARRIRLVIFAQA